MRILYVFKIFLSSAFSYRKGLGFFFVIVLSFKIAFAQGGDAGAWLAVAVSKKVNDRIGVKFVEEMRTQYYTMLSEFNSDFVADYELFNNFDLGIGYRISSEYDYESGFSQSHRNTFDIGYEFGFKSFDISYRLRYQLSYDKTEPNKSTFRNKAEVGYAFLGTPYRTSISSELYNRVDALGLHFPSKVRLSGGLKYFISPYLSSELYYLFQKELFVSAPEIGHVLGLQFSYKFK